MISETNKLRRRKKRRAAVATAAGAPTRDVVSIKQINNVLEEEEKITHSHGISPHRPRPCSPTK
jgi:hypothetical protein